MKKTYLILAMMLLSLSATLSAMTPIMLKINGVELPFIHDAVVPESMNEQFLKGVYVGTDADLKEEQITITDFKQCDKFTIAVLHVYDDYYAVTYRPAGGIIDGALLLKKDDIAMACDFLNPRGNRMTPESPTINIEENKVSVTRNFTTYVNAREKGGPIITEEGSVTLVYNVDSTGKMTVGEGSEHSKWTVKENASVPGSRGRVKESSESDNCRTLGLGMNIISLYTTPVSQENKEIPARLEILYKQFNEILTHEKNIDAQIVAKCLSELEATQEGMILRNPQLWLEWLDKNSDTKCMEILKKSIEDKDFKAGLQNAVKSLKDKKLRKAWEKRLK